MELKIWVEGIEKVVCGVQQSTTCQDVVFALAHATGKTGRFTLIEKWRNNERLLAPNESPLKILNKLGEYSSEVQFILQKSEKTSQNGNHNKSETKLKLDKDVNAKTPGFSKKDFASTDIKPIEHIGIVKGIPQQSYINKLNSNNETSPKPSNVSMSSSINNNNIIVSNNNNNSIITNHSGSNDLLNHSAISQNDIINKSASKERKQSLGQSSDNSNLSNENLLDLYNNHHQRLNTSNHNGNVFSPSPTISSSSVGIAGSLKPPAYRPPPAAQKLQASQIHNQNQNQSWSEPANNNNNITNGNFSPILSPNLELLMHSVQYRDLVQLIKYQREKLNTQQAELTKYDTEIVYLENNLKGRDHVQTLEAITQDINKTDQLYRQINEELQSISHVDDENDLVIQQEKTLRSEMNLLKSKMSILETELLQCRNKIKKLMDEIQIEQRNNNTQHMETRQMEQRIMSEVDRIQVEIEAAMQKSDNTIKTAENLKKEVIHIERDIVEKKKHLEKLVQEMKEVNLQSLTVATEDVIPFEGLVKTGRRILGSPRALENAVATSKNPHGVWV